MRDRRMHALTITELLMTLASFALLAAFAIPVMHGAAQQRDTTVCLANLRQLGLASLGYAAEDPRQQLIGLHRSEVLAGFFAGEPDSYWSWRLMQPAAFGGRAATVPLEVEPGVFSYIMTDEERFGAATRPLSIYLAAGGDPPVELFHCPADAGYPESLAGAWGEIPLPAVNMPLVDLLGNSYRMNTLGVIYLSSSGVVLKLSSSPFGHTPADVSEPEQTVLYSDPLFYALATCLAQDPEYPLIPGWHGELGADNVAYCDGSARTTTIGEIYSFSAEETGWLALMAGASWQYFLRRGPGWQMDCWPAPGAVTRLYQPNGLPAYSLPLYGDGWPYVQYGENERPW